MSGFLSVIFRYGEYRTIQFTLCPERSNTPSIPFYFDRCVLSLSIYSARRERWGTASVYWIFFICLFKDDVEINKKVLWWVSAEGDLAVGLDQLWGFDFSYQVGVFAIFQVAFVEHDAFATDAVEQPALIAGGDVIEDTLLLEQDGGVGVILDVVKTCVHWILLCEWLFAWFKD